MLQVFPALVLLCLLNSCSSYENHALTADSVALAYQPSYEQPTDSIPKVLLRKAHLHLEVENLKKSSAQLHAYCRQLNSDIVSSKWTHEEQVLVEKRRSDDSTITVSNLSQQQELHIRVPKAHFDSLLSLLQHVSTRIIAAETSTENVGLTYLGNELKNTNTLRLQRSLRKAKSTSTKGAVLAFSAEHESINNVVDLQLENLRMKDEEANASIHVVLSQPHHTFQTVHYTPDADQFDSPLYMLLAEAFTDGFSFFKEILIVLVRCWPLLLIAFFVYKIGRKKKWFPRVSSR
jgi:hypothetical protein